MYVSVSGNDANDGLSWGSAKLTVTAAICALPYGNCASSPRQAGSGTVIYQEGVALDTSANTGIWIGGANDSQFTTPGLPSRWMKEYAFGGLSVRCGTRSTIVAHQHQPGCAVGGITAGTNKPLIWLSGTSSNYYFADFFTATGTPVAWMGVDSTGCIAGSGAGVCTSSAVGQTISATLDNVSGGPTTTEPGQASSLIVGDGYWMHVRDSSFAGNPAYMMSVTAAVRASNVLTITTSAVCPFVSGDHISLYQIGDSTMQGTFTAASSCSGGHTFTINQTGPNVTASVTGSATALSDNAFAVVLVGPVISMRNLHAEGGGGIKFYAKANSNLQLFDDFMEGTANGTPLLWMSQLLGAGGFADASGLNMADTSQLPSVINDGAGTLLIRNEASQTTQVLGPSVVMGEFSALSRTSSLLSQGGSGFLNNQFLQANIDTARRTGGPTAVRFPNIAFQGTSQWTNAANNISGSGYTTATGKLDPFGGSNATELDSSGGTVTVDLYFNNASSVAVGDTFVGGVWIRNVNGNPSLNNVITIALNQLGGGSGDYCLQTNVGQFTGGAAVFGNAPYAGEGNWFWLTAACTIWSNPATPGLGFGVTINASNPVQVYRPYFGKIPTGTLSYNEQNEFINSIQGGFTTNAAAGDLAFYPTEKICLPAGASSGDTCGYIVHNNTANRTYTFPDASGNVCVSGVSCGRLYAATYNTQTNCNVNSASPAACGSAPSGSVVVPTTTTSYKINTSAVTVNSRIHVWPITDNSGLTGSPTCTTPASGYFGESGRVAGTSFTFTLPSTTGTTCWTYSIVN
jgi:hypothetical protein